MIGIVQYIRKRPIQWAFSFFVFRFSFFVLYALSDGGSVSPFPLIHSSIRPALPTYLPYLFTYQ